MGRSPKHEEEESASEGENEYEVERLVAHRRINQRGGVCYFLFFLNAIIYL